MSEPDLSAQLIEILLNQFGGNVIWLKNRCGCDAEGQPDVSGVFLGHPLFFEVKGCDPASRQNTRAFTQAEIRELTAREDAGAFAVGVLVLNLGDYESYLKAPAMLDVDCGVKYVLPRNIPEDGVVRYDGLNNLDLLKGGLFRRCIGQDQSEHCTKRQLGLAAV